MQTLTIALVSVNERGTVSGESIANDQSLNALQDWLEMHLATPFRTVRRQVSFRQADIEAVLRELADDEHCQLIFTNGGTGPYANNQTPDATLAVAERVLPGLGEQMRKVSLHFIATAILSRQVGVVRGSSVIVNLPGRPKAIKETLSGVQDADGNTVVLGVAQAIALCVQAVSGTEMALNM